MGIRNVLWASDFPGMDSPWPHSKAMGHVPVEATRGKEALNELVFDNAVKRCARHLGRLPHRREGRRYEQLVFLPNRPHTGLRRPRSATLAGFLAHAGTLVEILVDPGVDELV